jgi:hypothetical protein
MPVRRPEGGQRTLIRLLRSPVILGHTLHKRQAVRAR